MACERGGSLTKSPPDKGEHERYMSGQQKWKTELKHKDHYTKQNAKDPTDELWKT